MKILSIGWINVRRALRDRTGLFFLVALPLMLVFIIGAAFGGAGSPVLGVVGDAGALRAESAMQVRDFSDEAALRTAVEHGEASAGLVRVAGQAPRLLVRPDRTGQQLRMLVTTVLTSEANRLAAGEFVASHTGLDAATALSVVDSVPVEPVEVRTTTAGEALFPEDFSGFDLGAASQLIVFTFLNSLTAAAALVETRSFGVTRRMLATPTPARVIIAGEALGRVAIALLQGLIVVVGSALLFGVRWGDPLGAAALLCAFALVSGGAGLLLGAVCRTQQQTAGAGILLGLGLAAFGGCMVPIEFFSPALRTVAFATPHGWANDGFAALTRRGGDILTVAPHLSVLLGFAAALFALGAWRLQRAVTA
ncbi:ABC-2 type transport system permease protein [Lentzea waywayandensis]|uniref:ABC-2 type transport system permease protein n=1 Tax=Lentzea waywayandensis TaxID=84724 RepID=A0A1I6DAI1_9PSEU|nr:ABC transporter permease [Lentzea waywayandensis]SFR02439.1 ABC-2 type transport system permease protein [Lentzea waywayandensis]